MMPVQREWSLRDSPAHLEILEACNGGDGVPQQAARALQEWQRIGAGNHMQTNEGRRIIPREEAEGMSDRTLKTSRRGITTLHGFALLAIGVGIYATWIAVKYAQQPLLEDGGFRQTHTAMTAYWTIREGWHLAYETPVAGYPWQIPIEFPLYQWLVALITWLGGFPLDAVGRLVSFGFLMACAWPAFKVTRKLGLSSEVAWAFCALLWSSPIYLFWGRTFLIETAAVFFTFAAVPYAMDLLQDPPPLRSVLLFTFWATLGILQKATTTGPVMMVMGGVAAVHHLKTSGFRVPSRRKIVCVVLAFAVPLVAALVWARYTDLVKSQNLLGSQITSGALTLSGFMFGRNNEWLDLSVLRTIFWDRVLSNNAAGILGLVLLAAGFILGTRTARVILAASLLAFVSAILIFINLHIEHEYYQVGCTLWLTGALAVAAVLVPSRLRAKGAVALCITLVFVASNLLAFSRGYAKDIGSQLDEYHDTRLIVANLIRRYTPIGSGIVVYGMNWSSEIPYYAQRKAFAVPPWFGEYSAAWNDPSAFLGNLRLSAAVYCATATGPDLREILGRPDIRQQPDLFKVGLCYLWIPGVEGIVLPGSQRMIRPMEFLGRVLDAVPPEFGQVQPVANCDGWIDAVNGVSPVPQQTESAGLLPVDGWLAVSGKSGIAPDEVFVTLKGPDGTMKYVRAVRIPRPDVNSYFGQPAMPDVGFTVVVDGTALAGKYTLGLAWGHEGKFQNCAQFGLPVQFGASH